MPKRTPPVHRRHFLLLTAFLSAWSVVILARLVQLQIIQHQAYVQQARRQQEQTVEISPVRGTIYDRNMHPLAMSVQVESVFAVPSEISDAKETARLLKPILGMSEADLVKRLRGERAFSWIKRKVSAQEASRVRQLNLQGIHFQPETKRFYPKRELAAHVLGYVGLDDQGLAGIELRYDDAIRGQPGELLIEHDARRRWFGRTGKPPTPGQNVVLTLDENIQAIAERELDKAMAESRPLSGTVIVEDPHTGEILAMANSPTFNPNNYEKAGPAAQRNLAISGIYEPGSTFKIITYSSAFEEHLANPDEQIDCQMGSINVNGHIIHDHEALGLLTVEQAFEKSSDVCAIKIALRLGNDELYRYLRNYGFGSLTGIELPGEARGLTKPPEQWWKASIGAIAMGQEIGVTPLQVIAAASTIANRGVWVRPTIIREAPGVPGAEPSNAPSSVPLSARFRRVVSVETAAWMNRMMVQVVAAGTGRNALPVGYSAAGKTGTAQKLDPLTRAYSKTNYVASFVGFVPAEQPLYAILVVLDSPHGKHQGGSVAAPVFRAIAEQVLAYENVPPTVPQPLPLSLAAWRKPALSPPDDAASEGEATLPVEGPAEMVVPNFLGQSVRAITAQVSSQRLPVEVIGSGLAYEQTPSPGALLESGQAIVIHCGIGQPIMPQPPPQQSPQQSKELRNAPAKQPGALAPVGPGTASG